MDFYETAVEFARGDIEAVALSVEFLSVVLRPDPTILLEESLPVTSVVSFVGGSTYVQFPEDSFALSSLVSLLEIRFRAGTSTIAYLTISIYDVTFVLFDLLNSSMSKT